MAPTVGSLFTGAGGFDLGFERAGFRLLWQCENSHDACEILGRHWPGVSNHGDIRSVDWSGVPRPDVLIGGDPCPSRSVARGSRPSRIPDYYPEFLRAVRALQPLWVCRENVVPADPTDTDRCWQQLCELGYAAVVVDANSAEVTGQNRSRQFLCGVLESAGICPVRVFSEPRRSVPTVPSRKRSEWGPTAYCLTARGRRVAPEASYLIELGRGIRIVTPEEAERLQGFPPGWTDGFSWQRRRKLIGNAVTVPVAEWFGRAILEIHRREDQP
jgi:DNA (cytosine-5)-methyltransferase 1